MEPTATASVAFGATTFLFGGAAVVLLIGCGWLYVQLSATRAKLALEIEENERLNQLNERLKPFEAVADAEEEAARIRRDAALDSERAQQEAAAAREQAKEDADATRKEARAFYKDKQEQAAAMLSTASENAAKVIENARNQAESIAGGALHAMENAQQWEAVEKAMRNVVKGYGDSYMKPPQNVLDDLADDYDHKEAGRQLKMARDRSVLMVTEGRAATCDYVEAHRRETAIRFVTDAFNGKVDAILTKLKSTNAGTLEQKIKDAYALVNHNGAAFRSARITPEYLNARMAELKWGAAAMLLRDQEMEEQRAIKARIREEERAQRDFENAQKQAAKEEAQVRKAMEKAQKLLAKAHDDERAMYEAQLAELQEKLAEAMEKSERAVSMAQLTRSGHVYIISNIGSFGEQVFKIGMTRRLEPLDRVRELGDASVPFKFDVHAVIYSEDAPRLETALHHRFALAQVNKVNPRKEFFRATLAEIRAAVEELGLDVHWTMQAEALEYRESKALDDSLAADPQAREAWLARQARWEAYLEACGSEADEDADELPPDGLPPAVAMADA